MSDGPAKSGRNGALRIPMPFEDALRAALEVKPSEKKPAKKRKTGKKR